MTVADIRDVLKNNYHKLEKLVKKRFAPHQYGKISRDEIITSNLCDEALNYVLEKLEKESGKIISNYKTIAMYQL